MRRKLPTPFTRFDARITRWLLLARAPSKPAARDLSANRVELSKIMQPVVQS